MSSADLFRGLVLASAPPASVLLLGPDAESDAAGLTASTPGTVIHAYNDHAVLDEELGHRGRVEVAILLAAELQHSRAYIALTGRLRITHADRVWLALPAGADWQVSDLYALAMVEDDVPAGLTETHRLFRYDLESYTRVREWNNARNWANPENFHRYRW